MVEDRRDLLRIRVVSGGLCAAKFKLSREAGEGASHAKGHGKRVPDSGSSSPESCCGGGTCAVQHRWDPCDGSWQRAAGKAREAGPALQVPLGPGAEFGFYCQFSEKPVDGLVWRKDAILKAGPELSPLE